MNTATLLFAALLLHHYFPTPLRCCLNHENTSGWKSACFASRASFVLQSRMRAYDSTTFLFPSTILTVDGEWHSFFATSAHFRFESQFTAAKSQVYLLTMAYAFPDHGFERYKIARLPKTNGTMQMASPRRDERE